MFEDSQWQKYSSRFKTLPSLLVPREVVDGIIVCIPVFAEPALIATLESLLDCILPPVPVEVIIFFNQNDLMTEEESFLHDGTWNECVEWVGRHNSSGIQFKPIQISGFPDPRGGVGWARKVVMDEAARRLGSNGLIVCLDADCLLEKNYLTVVWAFFEKHPDCKAASIYYEHSLDGLPSKVRQGIVQYELHLRYLVHGMRWAGHPFAFQTVGSAMAVRRSAYLSQGGMNTRQAGEDFYFLQKFIELNSLYEIKETVVYPSARISKRVPFGTGRAMQKLLGESAEWFTTAFEIFRLIKPLLHHVELIRKVIQDAESSEFYDRLQEEIGIHKDVVLFLMSVDFISHCRMVLEHTSGPGAFRQRFFRYFNAFMMIRYMHYMRDRAYPDVPVEQASAMLVKEICPFRDPVEDPEELLYVFRQLDKNR